MCYAHVCVCVCMCEYMCVCVSHTFIYALHRLNACVRIISEHSLNTVHLIANLNFAEYYLIICTPIKFRKRKQRVQKAILCRSS